MMAGRTCQAFRFNTMAKDRSAGRDRQSVIGRWIERDDAVRAYALNMETNGRTLIWNGSARGPG